MPYLLAQQFEERGVHQRFLVHQQAEEFDRGFGPALLLEEFPRRVTVVLRDDVGPRVVAEGLQAFDERLQCGLPQRAGRPLALAGGKVLAQQRRLHVDVRRPVLAPEQVHPRLRVVHREVERAQSELLDIGKRQLVRTRNAHRARLGIQAGRERRAHRVDAPPDALLGFEEHRVVSGAQQRLRGRESRNARADDDDALARAGGRGKAVVGDVEGGGGRGGHARRCLSRARASTGRAARWEYSTSARRHALIPAQGGGAASTPPSGWAAGSAASFGLPVM